MYTITNPLRISLFAGSRSHVQRGMQCAGVAVAIGQFVDRIVDLPLCNIAAPKPAAEFLRLEFGATTPVYLDYRFEPVTRVRLLQPGTPIALSRAVFCGSRETSMRVPLHSNQSGLAISDNHSGATVAITFKA